MGQKIVVTISREYGSGGREVGRLLAEQLNIPFYDKELLTYMAQNSGLDEELFKEIDSKISFANFYFSDPKEFRKVGSNLHNLGMLGLMERIQAVQEKMITQLSQESCVIIGRCSDYILRNDPDVVKVFIRSSIQDKKQRVMSEYGEKEENLNARMYEIDSKRAAFYNHFTNATWAKPTNYDLMISTEKVSLKEAAKVIEAYVKGRK